MGRVERMLLNFCTKAWDAEDEVVRNRIAKRLPAMLAPPQDLLDVGVWRCFYRRHPEPMRKAREWNRIVDRLLEQFEAEDAAANAMNAIDQVLKGIR
jgi:hypothetical protein